VSEPRDERDSELSHIYKEGGWPEPRRQIDQAILAASRRAARREHSFVRRWSPGFALAATVVLSVTLLFRMSEEKPDDTLYSLPIPDQRAAPVAGESRSVEERKPDAAAKPPPTSKPRATPQPARAVGSVAARKSVPASKPAARAPAPPRPITPAAKPAPVERPAPAAPVPQAAPAASALKKEASETVRADRLEPVPEPRSQSQSAPEAAPTRESRPKASAPLPSVPPRTVEPFAQPAAPAAAGAASGAPEASDTAAEIVIRRSGLERSPQAWIEAIRELKTEGRIDEAGRELADFRKRYPDYALPEDFR